jgi:predicted RND superfamily exporter protein
MQSVADTAGSLVSPALILAGVSFTLMGVSTIAVVKELGLVLGRGALISLGMVLFFLPGMLVLLDRPIEKTTMNTSFLPRPHRKSRQSQNIDTVDTSER